jgi:hypothetical protein
MKAYSIYRLTVSSYVQKYSIDIEAENFSCSTGEINYKNARNSGLYFQFGSCINCAEGRKSRLGELEQIMVFALYRPTQQKATLHAELTKLNAGEAAQLRVPSELAEGIVDFQDSKEYWYEVMLGFLETRGWSV